MIVLTTAFALLASGATIAAPKSTVQQPALQPFDDVEDEAALLMDETEALDSDEFVFGDDFDNDDSLVDIEE